MILFLQAQWQYLRNPNAYRRFSLHGSTSSILRVRKGRPSVLLFRRTAIYFTHGALALMAAACYLEKSVARASADRVS